MLFSVPSKSITVALISYSLQSGWRTCASKSLDDSHKTLCLLFPKVLTEFSVMCTPLVAFVFMLFFYDDGVLSQVDGEDGNVSNWL